MRRASSIWVTHLASGAEHLAIVDFLEALAIGLLERDLAYEKQQRRAVLHGDVNADGAVAGAWAAGDEGSSGTAFQLAVGVRHIDRARLEPTGDGLNAIMHVVKAIEDVEIALARDDERGVDSLGNQGVGQNAAAAARRTGWLFCG